MPQYLNRWSKASSLFPHANSHLPSFHFISFHLISSHFIPSLSRLQRAAANLVTSSSRSFHLCFHSFVCTTRSLGTYSTLRYLFSPFNLHHLSASFQSRLSSYFIGIPAGQIQDANSFSAGRLRTGISNPSSHSFKISCTSREAGNQIYSMDQA